MYHTFRELVIATRTIFATQKRLNPGRYEAMGGDHPANRGNDVGCAIGCHFGTNLQQRLDEPDFKTFFDEKTFSFIKKAEVGYGGNGIQGILESSPERAAIIRSVIGEGVTAEDMAWLQALHDESQSLQEFLDALDGWLTNYPEAGVEHPLFTVPESHIIYLPQDA